MSVAAMKKTKKQKGREKAQAKLQRKKDQKAGIVRSGKKGKRKMGLLCLFLGHRRDDHMIDIDTATFVPIRFSSPESARSASWFPCKRCGVVFVVHNEAAEVVSTIPAEA